MEGFEDGMNLNLKCLQSNISLSKDKATIFSGLKHGLKASLVNLNVSRMLTEYLFLLINHKNNILVLNMNMISTLVLIAPAAFVD